MEEETRVLERILHGAEEPRDLPLALLKSITNDFSEERKIGQGGFGEVFKGELRNKVLAVKRMYVNEHTIDDKAFRREIKSLMNTKHQNVVRFLGFCSHTHREWMKHAESGEWNLVNINERLLCSEYIGNGSLDKHITDELRGLEWETRYKIITGICKGLKYLHEDRNIIHMDLKPQNILLDHDMVPKITDFGLSRPNKESHTMGLRFGTQGYFAPEYGTSGKTSLECDIYSLGTIIIELVLQRWGHRWNNTPTPRQYQQVNGCIDIAVCCKKQNPEARPSIKEIIDLLNEITNGHTGQASQISPCLDEDDMLRINPLELRLPSELKNEISRSIELINDTCKCIAINIRLPRARYIVQPDKGTVRPKSKYSVKITVQAGDVQRNNHADKFIVHSMQVQDRDGLRDEDVTERMFEKTSKFVDKVDLMIVYEPQENFKRRGETNIPDEEVPKAKKRKTVESAPREGKNKLGSSDNTEGTSIDTSSSAQGQYTKQIDRYNFHPPEYFSRGWATNTTYLLNVSDRAIDVTSGAMGSLLHKLGVLHKEFNLETSIEKDADELVNMQQVLRKVPDVQQDYHRVKRWATNVRDMSYDLEDFVDGFLVNSEPFSNSTCVRELTHEMCFPLEKGKSHQPIDDLIKHHISKRVQDAVQRGKKCKVDKIVANATTKADIEDPRISCIYIDREQLIGIEAPKKELLSLLEEDSDKSKLKIFSIVGFGGMGKTTLVKEVHDEIKGFLKDIICELDKDFSAANLDVGKLQKKNKEFLTNKRYFIVIDDIWNSSEWNCIRHAFPDNKNGSRVMITTRDHDIALACCNANGKYVYRIKPLSDEDSEFLFFGRIFGSEEACPDALNDISNDILKRCGGMPLAINCIASYLARHPSESSWERVRKSLGAIEGNDIEKMKKILDLSYILLPHHLKTCLLHVCMYPEDREIEKNALLRKWVAEGFVSTDGVEDAEDVAEEYFKALVDMFMIQPWKIDYYNNEVLSCKVHYIILELMRFKSSKERFTHVIDGLKDVSGQIHRVSVEDNDQKDSRILEVMNKGSLEHVRSVLLYRTSLVPYFMKYNYVRVLHIFRDGFPRPFLDLTGISRLFLLRYLKIECYDFDGVVKLPEQIGKLQQLETLDIDEGVLKHFPSDIVSLPLLSHLRCRSTGRVVLPDGIDRLKLLRTLVRVSVSGSSVENIKGLGELKNLRELHIWEEKIELGEATSMHMEALHSSICKLSASLRILYLRLFRDTTYDTPCRYYWSSSIFPLVSNIRDLDLGCCSFQRCPRWIGELRNLYKLRIVVTEVADGVSIVAGLPLLAYFCLFTENPEKEESVVISAGGAFKALKELCFHCSKTLLTFEAGALPKLGKLDMLFRYHMARRFLPVGIEHLPSTTLNEIYLGMDDEEDYFQSYEYRDNIPVHQRRFRIMLTRAFKPHHPAADIILYWLDGDIEEFDDTEEGIDDEEYCCNEGFYSEEDKESAYHVNRSQSSVQLFQLSEAAGCSSQDSAEVMSKFQPPNQQNDGEFQEVNDLIRSCAEENELPFTRLLAPATSSLELTLALCSSPERAWPVGNFPVDTNNDLFVQRGNAGVQGNAVGQYLDLNIQAGLVDLNQAPPAELLDLNQAPEDEVTS